jgi:hypothetical protein
VDQPGKILQLPQTALIIVFEQRGAQTRQFWFVQPFTHPEKQIPLQTWAGRGITKIGEPSPVQVHAHDVIHQCPDLRMLNHRPVSSQREIDDIKAIKECTGRSRPVCRSLLAVTIGGLGFGIAGHQFQGFDQDAPAFGIV